MAETWNDPGRLVRQYAPSVYRLAYARTGSRADAEDVMQEVFLRLIKAKPAFDSEAHAKAWLLRVTINLCKNKLRFYRNHPGISMEELSLWYETAEERQVMTHLLELPRTYREVLLLHYVEGYRCGEIAGLLRCTETAVRKRLERARKQLYQSMGGEKDV